MAKLKGQLERDVLEAVSAIEYEKDNYGKLPDKISVRANALISVSRAKLDSGPGHIIDSDCLVDIEFSDGYGHCVVCGAYHGERCRHCNARAFHTMPCTIIWPLHARVDWSKMGPG